MFFAADFFSTENFLAEQFLGRFFLAENIFGWIFVSAENVFGQSFFAAEFFFDRKKIPAESFFSAENIFDRKMFQTKMFRPKDSPCLSPKAEAMGGGPGGREPPGPSKNNKYHLRTNITILAEAWQGLSDDLGWQHFPKP